MISSANSSTVASTANPSHRRSYLRIFYALKPIVTFAPPQSRFTSGDNRSTHLCPVATRLEQAEMVRKVKLKKQHDSTSDHRNVFKILISALESDEGINPGLLKSTCLFLRQLYKEDRFCLGKGRDLNELAMKCEEGEVRVSLRDLKRLSSILFEHLERRLKQLQSSTRSLELEELSLLIRCCMLNMTWYLPQQYLLDSLRVLLVVFKKLTLFEVASDRSLSCGCMDSDSFANVASLCIPSITAILQVVVDELLINGRLRKYLERMPGYFPGEEQPYGGGDEFGVMTEMLYSHFSLSIFDEGCLEEFLNTIPCNNSKSLELSITAGSLLLQNPVFLSSPKLLQAHIISLVSASIDKIDPRLIDNYLALLETSLILYTRHMSIFKTDNHSRGNSFISQACAKRQKLDETIATLNNSWNLTLRGKLFKTKSDLLASSIEYVSQILPTMRHIACQDEVLFFLKCMLTRAANDDDNDLELPINSVEDISFLASLLMLISNSLIQSVWCIKSCKGYDFIVDFIKCFKDFIVRLPIQKFCCKENMGSCKELRLMFVHFLGLLSLSFDSRLDFLVKSCTFVILGLINVFVFEKGNIDDLSSLFQGTHVICKQPRRVSQQVVANFQKIRKRINTSGNGCEESCSGEVYLKSRNATDFDDLGDFVECKKGRDYASWLKNRDRFRKRQLSKRAKRMWAKKRLAYRSSKSLII